MPMTVLNLSLSIKSIAKFSRSTKTIAPRKGPMGFLNPPTTAITRMSITTSTPIEPGEIRPLNQTSKTPAVPAIKPDRKKAIILCQLTW